MNIRRILKFALSPAGTYVQTADEPRFLSVGFQGDALVLWAEAAVGDAVTTRLAALPTGWAAPLPTDAAEYIGTAQHPTLMAGGSLVLHVYRERHG